MTPQHPAAPESPRTVARCPRVDLHESHRWTPEPRVIHNAALCPGISKVIDGRAIGLHPAAPETETDANGIVALLDEHLPGDYTHMFFTDPGAVDPPVDCRCGHRREWGVSHHQHLAGIIATAARERVRVVEGERDAAREALDNYLSDPPLPIGNDVIADAQETAAHALEANRMNLREIERLIEELADANESAESAEAAHEAEKAAHERLRAGVEALADEWAEDYPGPDAACNRTPDEWATTLRSLLGGGEAR